MMSEKHPTGKHLPHPVKPVLLCSLIGAAVVALLLAGFSFLLTLQDLPQSAVEPLALLAGGAGCLLAGFLCAKLHGRSGLLTGAAMLRYTDRQNNPEPKNVAEAFLDDTYDDDWMEHHWPNMVVTKDAESE